jgi:hypothetical protein
MKSKDKINISLLGWRRDIYQDDTKQNANLSEEYQLAE